eukprot:gene19106-25711_t
MRVYAYAHMPEPCLLKSVPTSYTRCDDCHNQPEGGLDLQLSLPHAFGVLAGGGSTPRDSLTQAQMNGNLEAGKSPWIDGLTQAQDGLGAKMNGNYEAGLGAITMTDTDMHEAADGDLPNFAHTTVLVSSKLMFLMVAQSGTVSYRNLQKFPPGEARMSRPLSNPATSLPQDFPKLQSWPRGNHGGRPTSTPPDMQHAESSKQNDFAKQRQQQYNPPLFRPPAQNGHTGVSYPQLHKAAGSRSGAESGSAAMGGSCVSYPQLHKAAGSRSGAESGSAAMGGSCGGADTPTSQHGHLNNFSRHAANQLRPLELRALPMAYSDIPMPSSADWMAAVAANGPLTGAPAGADDMSNFKMDRQLLLQPVILLADPQCAAQLAAELGLDEAHQMAAQKSAQILKTLVQLGNETPSFQTFQEELRYPSSSLLLQSDRISDQIMNMPLSAVLDTGTRSKSNQGGIPSTSQSLRRGSGLRSCPSGGQGTVQISIGGCAQSNGMKDEGLQRRCSGNGAGGTILLGSGSYRFQGSGSAQPQARGSADSAPLSDGFGGERRNSQGRQRSDNGGAGGAASAAFEMGQYAEACLQNGNVRPGRANSLPPPTASSLDSGVVQLSESALHPSASQPLHHSKEQQQREFVSGVKRARVGNRSSGESGKNEGSRAGGPSNGNDYDPTEVDLLDSQKEMDAMQALFDLATESRFCDMAGSDNIAQRWPAHPVCHGVLVRTQEEVRSRDVDSLIAQNKDRRI